MLNTVGEDERNTQCWKKINATDPYKRRHKTSTFTSTTTGLIPPFPPPPSPSPPPPSPSPNPPAPNPTPGKQPWSITQLATVGALVGIILLIAGVAGKRKIARRAAATIQHNVGQAAKIAAGSVSGVGGGSGIRSAADKINANTSPSDGRPANLASSSICQGGSGGTWFAGSTFAEDDDKAKLMDGIESSISVTEARATPFGGKPAFATEPMIAPATGSTVPAGGGKPGFASMQPMLPTEFVPYGFGGGMQGVQVNHLHFASMGGEDFLQQEQQHQQHQQHQQIKAEAKSLLPTPPSSAADAFFPITPIVTPTTSFSDVSAPMQDIRLNLSHMPAPAITAPSPPFMGSDISASIKSMSTGHGAARVAAGGGTNDTISAVRRLVAARRQGEEAAEAGDLIGSLCDELLMESNSGGPRLRGGGSCGNTGIMLDGAAGMGGITGSLLFSGTEASDPALEGFDSSLGLDFDLPTPSTSFLATPSSSASSTPQASYGIGVGSVGSVGGIGDSRNNFGAIRAADPKLTFFVQAQRQLAAARAARNVAAAGGSGGGGNMFLIKSHFAGMGGGSESDGTPEHTDNCGAVAAVNYDNTVINNDGDGDGADDDSNAGKGSRHPSGGGSRGGRKPSNGSQATKSKSKSKTKTKPKSKGSANNVADRAAARADAFDAEGNYHDWVLGLGIKDRNQMIKRMQLDVDEKTILIKAVRKYKQLISKRKYVAKLKAQGVSKLDARRGSSTSPTTSDAGSTASSSGGSSV